MTKTRFEDRFNGRLEKLKTIYTKFYRKHTDVDAYFDQLVHVMRVAYKERSAVLIAEDDSNPRWYMSNKLVGMMLYTDLFAGDLDGVAGKIPYLKDPVSYTHLTLPTIYSV